ncbi:MAG TPA: hypothetical protein VGE76_18825 [Opitutaceae bacterium]
MLDTPSYSIVIEEHCPGEGEVGCHDVTYIGTSKRSGNHITLKGTTSHTYPDGVTPSRYLGHVFKNGSTTYFVHLEGRLEVRQGSRVLVNEEGEWKEGR